MSLYQERAHRVDASFSLEFITDGERIYGVCQNLSASGMLAKFTVPLEIWTLGEVDLHFGTNLLGVKVRVVRVIGLEAGLAFIGEDEHWYEEVRALIDAAQKGGLLLSHPVTLDHPQIPKHST